VVRSAGLGLLLALLGGCGPDASNDAPLRGSHACLPGACQEAAASPPPTDAGVGSAPLEPWPDSNAGPLSGVYASEVVVGASVAGYPVTLRLLFRLRLLQTGTTTKQSTTLCSLRLPSVPNLASLVIPPLLESVIQKNSVVVSEGEYLSGAGVYTPPPFLLVLGAKLADPASDPLPTMTDMAGAWDEDGDGHPGVTVDATVFTCGATSEQLYVALRTGGTLSAHVTGPDTIDGTEDLFETEDVLGYSNACLSAATDIDPRLSPDSPFHATRLADEAALHAAGNVTCGDILSKAAALFGSGWDD
jgi:hypothetical protein